jgi:hypothetical protein
MKYETSFVLYNFGGFFFFIFLLSPSLFFRHTSYRVRDSGMGGRKKLVFEEYELKVCSVHVGLCVKT